MGAVLLEKPVFKEVKDILAQCRRHNEAAKEKGESTSARYEYFLGEISEAEFLRKAPPGHLRHVHMIVACFELRSRDGGPAPRG